MNRDRLRSIHDKTGGQCWYCGITLHPLSDWQVEHQRPRAQGGGDEMWNLVPACRQCNSQKGSRTVDQYRHALLVKLENAITTAFEVSMDMCGLMVEQKPHAPPEDGYTPERLDDVNSLLHHAADIAVNLRLEFFGERMLLDEQPESVSEAESIQ